MNVVWHDDPGAKFVHLPFRFLLNNRLRLLVEQVIDLHH